MPPATPGRRTARKYVERDDHAAYIAAVGGAARIDAIPAPVF